MPGDKTNVPAAELVQPCSAAEAAPQTLVAFPFGPIPLAEVEKRHILAVLEYCKGNRTQAAKVLQVSIRTLRNKLHEYNRVARSGKDGNPRGTQESQEQT